MFDDVSSSVWAGIALASLVLLLPMPWWFGHRDTQASKLRQGIGIAWAVVLLLIGGAGIILSFEPRILRDPFFLVLSSSCFGLSILGIAMAIWYVLLVFLRRKTKHDASDGWQRQFTIYQLLGGTFLCGVLFAVARVVYVFPRPAQGLLIFFLALVSMTVIAGGVVHVMLRSSDPSPVRRKHRQGSKSITLPPELSGKQPGEEPSE